MKGLAFIVFGLAWMLNAYANRDTEPTESIFLFMSHERFIRRFWYLGLVSVVLGVLVLVMDA